MATGADVVREASALLRTPGAHYDQCASRCEVWQWPHCVDCSGLTSATLNQLGLNEGCTGSFQQSIESHRVGGGLPFSVAINTPGAFAWEGINQGQGGVPGRDPGHVGIFVGDGTHTLEARGHWAGIGLFFARSLVWDYCGMMPGVTRADGPIPVPLPHPLPPHPPQITQEDSVSMVALPNSAVTQTGREASARPVKGFNFVLLEDGGRVQGDVQIDAQRHWWAPTPAERPPGSQLIDCMKSLDGKFLVARYGFPNGDAGTYRTAIVGA